METFTITGEGQADTWRLEQEGIFIILHLLCHGASVFLVSSEGPPMYLVASYDILWDAEDLF
jgi:hypothetical protein